MRITLHYITSLMILPFYGIQVCPFIESLSVIQVITPFGVALGLQFAFHRLFGEQFIASQSLENRVSRAFWMELGLFTTTALILMFYNFTVHDFPLGSGLKVLVGVMGLGFFAAVDFGLSEEMRVADAVKSGQIKISLSDHPFSMTRRLALFATASILVLFGVLFLLAIKDLDWIVEVGDSIPLEDARTSVLKEFAFVMTVLLLHTLNIIRLYGRNLKNTFFLQTSVMDRVTSGEYGVRVPVSTNDEFGYIAQHTNTMVTRIEERTEELYRTRDVTILAMATLAETRDNETGAHILRTQRYLRVLAEYLQNHPNFQAELTSDNIKLMFKSAPLHDVGKVGIPDAILLKPGKLSEDEFVIMKTHAQLGADALRVAERELGTSSFLRYAREIAQTHHEKWDGSGYPHGLKSVQIAISGRLMAVADVYDALISKRVYKPAFTHEKAMSILREGSGSHFDPEVIAALDSCEAQFKEIAQRFGDAHTQVIVEAPKGSALDTRQ